MGPSQIANNLRHIAARIDDSKNPSQKLVVQALRTILAGLDDLENVIAEVHEDKSEQLKQLALMHLSDTESIKQQALQSLEKELQKADWEFERGEASAYSKLRLEINGVSIPITVSVGDSVTISLGVPYGGKMDKTVEGVEYFPGLEEAGLNEADVDEYGLAYCKEYEAFDWDDIFEWLVQNSSAEDVGKNALYEHSDTEPAYGYYDLRGRG